ncbi:hypothetical protein ACFQZC_09945 [Streptacidiphilus monticola]
METVAVAVLAGLRSLTLAVVSALLLGVVQSELTQLQSPTWHAVSANVFVLALLAGGLWLLPRGSETRPVPPVRRSRPTTRTASSRSASRSWRCC